MVGRRLCDWGDELVYGFQNKKNPPELVKASKCPHDDAPANAFERVGMSR